MTSTVFCRLLIILMTGQFLQLMFKGFLYIMFLSNAHHSLNGPFLKAENSNAMHKSERNYVLP